MPLRAKFPVIVRASPPEGWPRGAVMVSEGKIPYRNFLQIIGAAPDTEFEAQLGEYQDNDPRMILSMLEEISLNCPLREDEAEAIQERIPRPLQMTQGKAGRRSLSRGSSHPCSMRSKTACSPFPPLCPCPSIRVLTLNGRSSDLNLPTNHPR